MPFDITATNFKLVGPALSGAPYQTVAAALASITDNAYDNPYTIGILPGEYTGGFEHKKYVDIIGSGRSTVLDLRTASDGYIKIPAGEMYSIRSLFCRLTDDGPAVGNRGAVQVTGAAVEYLLEDVDFDIRPNDARTTNLYAVTEGSSNAGGIIRDCDIYTEACGIRCSSGNATQLHDTNINMQGPATSTYGGKYHGVEVRGTSSRLDIYGGRIGTGYRSVVYGALDDGRVFGNGILRDNVDVAGIVCQDTALAVVFDTIVFARCIDPQVGQYVNALRAEGGIIRYYGGWAQNEIFPDTNGNGSPSAYAAGAEGTDKAGRIVMFGPKMFTEDAADLTQNVTVPGMQTVRTVTASATLSNGRDFGGIIKCDATSGPITYTINATERFGTEYHLIKVDSSANAVNIVLSGDTLVGGGSLTLSSQWDQIVLRKISRSEWIAV